MNRYSKEISSLYNEDYYRHVCGGEQEAQSLESGALTRRLLDAFNMAKLKGTEDVLDVGCGRGEIVSEAAKLGCQALGIDYSPDAISHSKQRIKGKPWAGRCHFLIGDIASHKLEKRKFDVIFALDVFEHLHSSELQSLLGSIKEHLKPDGRLIFHTSPNRYFYTVAYKTVRWLSLFCGRARIQREGRCPFEQKMHINELTGDDLKNVMTDVGLACDIRYFGLERILNTIEQARFRRIIVRFLCHLACWPFLRVYTNSDLTGIAGHSQDILNESFRLAPSDSISLDHPFLFHEGWYVPVLHLNPSHRWSTPFFSLKAWSEKPMRIRMQFSRQNMTPDILLKTRSKGFRIELSSDSKSYYCTIQWPATSQPMTIQLASRHIYAVRDDPRIFGACLQHMECEYV